MERFPFDDDYVRRLKERDPQVSEHFSTYFGGLLLAKLRRRLSSRELIEDVRQEVLLRVLMKLDDLQDSRKLGAYVNSVCNLVLQETYRRLLRDAPAGESPDCPGSLDIENELVAEETRRSVRETLESLPEHDSELLRAVFFEEADKDEICLRFGVTREYLRVLVHRALKAFRKRYCRKCEPPPDS